MTRAGKAWAFVALLDLGLWVTIWVGIDRIVRHWK
jgi:hypothetical protein